MTHYIKDYGLTADQLAVKYELLGEHPGYTRGSLWVECLLASSFWHDYWGWVVGRLVHEQDELEQDNPYNPPVDLS